MRGIEKTVDVPRADERKLWDLFMGIPVRQAVIVAHDLGVFALLDGAPRTSAEVGAALGLAPRATDAMLLACVSLGLLRVEGDRYALTEVSEQYLLERSPTYFGRVLDVGAIANGHLMSFDSVKRAITSNESQVYSGDKLFEAHEQEVAQARAFTGMMHGHSIGPALAWPRVVDLSAHRHMLDIGGGSGIHAIAAVQRWPALVATVFDMAPVCDAAQEYIERHGAGERVGTHVGDMWDEPFPAADVHFYADIFHDWPRDRCEYLARKSFESLPSGGRLVIHEMLLDDDRQGPRAVLGYNITMLLWTEGQQFSGAELGDLLEARGFVDIAVTRTFGYWGVATGRKP